MSEFIRGVSRFRIQLGPEFLTSSFIHRSCLKSLGLTGPHCFTHMYQTSPKERVCVHTHQSLSYLQLQECKTPHITFSIAKSTIKRETEREREREREREIQNWFFSLDWINVAEPKPAIRIYCHSCQKDTDINYIKQTSKPLQSESNLSNKTRS